MANLKIIPVCIAVLFFMGNIYAQRIAVKTNLLYDATTSFNLEGEIRMSNHSTFSLSAGFNPWNFSNNTRLKHISVKPEFRYWLYEPFAGHFFGASLMYADFNIGGIKFLSNSLKNNRYEGWLGAASLSYGYHYPISTHWSIEGSIGIGINRIDYNQYKITEPDKLVKKKLFYYIGPNQISLSIVYVIK